MDKVKISQEQANAIESKRIRDDGEPVWTNKDFAEAYIFGIGNTQKVIRQLSFESLMMALIIGYEVEASPMDRVKELYDYFDQEGVHFAGVDVRNKVARMFTMLNIPIAGVNHD